MVETHWHSWVRYGGSTVKIIFTWRSMTQVHLGFWSKISKCRSSMKFMSEFSSPREIIDDQVNEIGKVFRPTKRNCLSSMVGLAKSTKCSIRPREIVDH
jgi:hypothetical protein